MRETSLEAYESILDRLPAMRRRVFACFLLAGSAGRTCDEAEEVLDGRHQSVSARVNELAKSGHLLDSGRRRETRSGRRAIVWVAYTHAGTQELFPRH